MNVLDENVADDQRLLLERSRVRVRQIGVNIGRFGMQDEEIIRLLLSLRRPTFFTRDDDFYDRQLCHPNYCLVYLAIEKSEVALFVRWLLRHPNFNTQAKRMGRIIRASRGSIASRSRLSEAEERVSWF